MPRVLVVDNDAEYLQLLKLMFSSYNDLTIMAAVDGEDAIRQFNSYPDISVILMDLYMPGTDGFQVIELIRGRSQVPIFAVTAAQGLEDRVKKAGGNGYILKPCGRHNLYETIEPYLH